MSEANPRPEGPTDVGEPAEEGAKIRPDEDPRRRNMSGRLPGESNESASHRPEANKAKSNEEKQFPRNRSEGRH